MYDEAVDDSLAALKLISDWFVTSNIVKKHLTASYPDEIYSILMKSLVMLYLTVINLVFLIKI